MTAKYIVEKGARWVISNGKKVHIWEDRWIPTTDSFKVVSPRSLSSEKVMVPSLIDMDRRSWDVAKVNNTFFPFEAQVISGIPISPRLPKDSLIWAWTPNGRFSVKSAYSVAQRCVQQSRCQAERGESFDGSRLKALWKSIWNLDCLNMVKHFMWKASKNILPTKWRLKARGIGEGVSCDVCGENETSGHVLWGCKTAKEACGATKLKLSFLPESHTKFLDIMWEIRERCPRVGWELFAITAWKLCNNKNNIRHGVKNSSVEGIVKEAKEYAK